MIGRVACGKIHYDMRIAIFHELPHGGARRAINEYSRQLKKNHLVDLFFVDDNKSNYEDKFYSNIFFYKFVPKIWKGRNWKVRLYKDTIELINLYKLNRKIARGIDNKKYDIVMVSASKFIEAPFVMRFLKTPFVFYCHDPNYRIIYDPLLAIPKDLDPIRYLYEKLNRLIRKILDKQNIKYASLCVAPSKFIGNLFFKTYNKEVKIVYYGVDTSLFKPKNIVKDIDIFYIGSHHPIDGYSLVKDSIMSMKLKPNVRILMTEMEWISDDKKLLELYQKSKIVLCTAKKEGLGSVALEAMACGVPVVAVDEAGHKETIIDEMTGFLLPRDPIIFAKKLDWLLSYPKMLIKIGNKAREIMVKKWGWKSQSQELENIFKNYLLRKKQ